MPGDERNPEDAPVRGPGSQPSADDAQLRTQRLTQELLDWAIAALEAVLSTPELRQVHVQRPRRAFQEALKFADYLYPLTLTKENPADATSPLLVEVP